MAPIGVVPRCWHRPPTPATRSFPDLDETVNAGLNVGRADLLSHRCDRRTPHEPRGCRYPPLREVLLWVVENADSACMLCCHALRCFARVPSLLCPSTIMISIGALAQVLAYQGANASFNEPDLVAHHDKRRNNYYFTHPLAAFRLHYNLGLSRVHQRGTDRPAKPLRIMSTRYSGISRFTCCLNRPFL